MKLLFISSDNNRTSGAFLCLAELARCLRERHGVESLVVLPKKGDGAALLDRYGIPYRYVPSYSWVTYLGCSPAAVAKSGFKAAASLYNRRAIRQIRQIIREEQPDLVQTNTIFSYVGAVAALQEHKKHVWHLRENLAESFHSKILCEKKGYALIGRSDAVVAVSQKIQQSYGPSIPHDIQVIYDGVSSALYEKRNILQENTVSLCCIGALNQNKHQLDLIHALALVRQRGLQNFRLRLVGRGPMKDQLCAAVKKAGLEDFITFAGTVSDIKSVLEQTDIVCVASKSEAFGRTTAEGMLQGCLIIGADSDGSATGELLRAGKTGLLYPCGDIEALASLLITCLKEENRPRLRKLAADGQQYARHTFTTEKNADAFFALYQSLLNG